MSRNSFEISLNARQERVFIVGDLCTRTLFGERNQSRVVAVQLQDADTLD